MGNMTRLLTVEEVAERCGVQPGTIRAYNSREQMPQPDVTYGRTPLWKPKTIETWMASRPRISDEQD